MSIATSLTALVAAAAPSVGTAPPAVSAYIHSTVAREPGTNEYRYDYTITNTSSADAIGAFRIEGDFVNGRGFALPGWGVAPSVAVGAWIWRVVDPAASLAPGRSLSNLRILSQALPGVAQVTVFPAVTLAWDDTSPGGRAYNVIGPAIGTLNRQPADAALAILRQLRQTFIPPLAADRDGAAEPLDRVLGEAVSAVARGDRAAGEDALRDAQAVPWASASTWRADLHRSLDTDLAYVFDLLGRSTELDESEQTGGPTSLPGSNDEFVWVYPGVAPAATTDLHAFIGQTALGFVATVENVSRERAVRIGSDHRTRLWLRPTEVFWGAPAETSSIDVWIRGVTYHQGKGPGAVYRVASGSADAAFALKPGETVFVAATRFEKLGSPLNGQLFIADPATFTRLQDGHAWVSGAESQRWIQAVVKQGRALSTTDGPKDDATLFLTALRTAARQRAK